MHSEEIPAMGRVQDEVPDPGEGSVNGSDCAGLQRRIKELLKKNEELHNANVQLSAALKELKEKYGVLTSRAKTLGDSEQKFRTIFNNTTDAIEIHEIGEDGTPGKFIDINDIACAMLGYTREELLDKTPLDIATEYHNPPLETILAEQRRTGSARFETEHRRKDGTVVPVEVKTHIVDLMGRKVMLAVTRDITERKRTEDLLRRFNEELEQNVEARTKELLESREIYRDLVENINEVIFSLDPNGIITFISPSIEQMTRSPPSEIIGRNFLEFVHPDDVSGLQASFQATLHGKPEQAEFRAYSKDGILIHLRSSSRSHVENGRVVGLTGVLTDITERKQVEERLNQQFLFLQQLIDTIPNPIFYKDSDGIYLGCNRAFEEYIGLPRDQLIGKSVYQIAPKDLADKYFEMDKKLLDHPGTQTYEARVRYADGSIHDVIFFKATFSDIQRTVRGLVGVILDITARKNAENALRESREMYRELVENINDVIFSLNLEGNFTYISPVIERLYGYSPEEMIGHHFSNYIHPDDHPACIQAFVRRLKGEYGLNEFRIVASDGRIHYVMISQRPILDSGGEVLGFNYIMTNITERRLAEAALHQANEKLNMLSSITRHDILNLIMAIRGYLEFSLDLEREPEIREFMEKEKDAVNAIQRQIEFTRFYQDIGVAEPKWQDVKEIIDQVVKELDLTGVVLDNQVSGLEVYADPLIEKVFYNLIENSLRHGEHVTSIGFSPSETDSGLVISYRDNGVGITDEDKKKLFQRGFGKHTGLGLFLSREILSITGITIRETGVPGKGVCFEILVPKGGYREIPGT